MSFSKRADLIVALLRVLVRHLDVERAELLADIGTLGGEYCPRLSRRLDDLVVAFDRLTAFPDVAQIERNKARMVARFSEYPDAEIPDDLWEEYAWWCHEHTLALNRKEGECCGS